MYILVLSPLLVAAWFLFSRFCFGEKVDHRPLLYFGVLLAIASVGTELVLGHPFAWLQFAPVRKPDLEATATWQHGLSAAVAATYLIAKRSRAPKDVGLAVALWAVCNAAFITAVMINARIDYPFGLEWMEGTMVDQTLVAKQGAIYVAPTPEFTPFLYGPAFFRILSPLPYMEQSPFIWGRLMSLAMTGMVVLLLYFCATKLAENAWIGLLVSVSFFASHPYSGSWFDLYRIDTTFVFFLLLGGVLLWQRPQSRVAIFAAGLSLTLAVLTKQAAALMVLVYVLWFFLAHGWKRALWLIGAGAGTGLVLMGVEFAFSGAYFFEYFVEMLFTHPPTYELIRNKFVDRDLFALPGILTTFLAVSALVANFRRVGAREWFRSMFPFLIVILTVTSFFMRAKVGGWNNCRIPMILAGLLGVAMWFGEQHRRPGPAGAYPGLILMVVYMWFMDPLGTLNARQIPSKKDLTIQQGFVEYLRSRPGTVWVPFHTHLCYTAKRQMCHNTIAMDDWNDLHASIPESFAEQIESGPVDTIVLDYYPRWFKGPLSKLLRRHFRCTTNRLGWGKNQGRPMTGWRPRPKHFCERKRTKKKNKNEKRTAAPPTE